MSLQFARATWHQIQELKSQTIADWTPNERIEFQNTEKMIEELQDLISNMFLEDNEIVSKERELAEIVAELDHQDFKIWLSEVPERNRKAAKDWQAHLVPKLLGMMFK